MTNADKMKNGAVLCLVCGKIQANANCGSTGGKLPRSFVNCADNCMSEFGDVAEAITWDDVIDGFPNSSSDEIEWIKTFYPDLMKVVEDYNQPLAQFRKTMAPIEKDFRSEHAKLVESLARISDILLGAA